MNAISRIALVGLLALAVKAQDLVPFPQQEFTNDDAGSLGTIVDVNGDGLLDVVLFAPDPPVGLLVHFGHGNGIFGQPLHVPGPGDGRAFSGDTTGDGRADVVTYSYSTANSALHLTVYPATGSSLGRPVETHIDFPPELYTLHDTMLADMDGDGLEDFVGSVLIENLGEQLLIARSLGDGSFSALPLHAVPSSKDRQLPIDFDLDGTLDMVFTTSSLSATSIATDTIEAEQGLGNGLLSSTSISSPLPAAAAPDQALFPAPASGDMDGDGAPDLVVVETTYPTASVDTDGGQVSVLLSQHDGTFNPSSTTVMDSGGEPRLGDLDQDGALDVVVVQGGLLPVPTLTSFLGDGAGGLRLSHTVNAAVNTFAPGPEAGLLDLDGDGELDISLGSYFLSGTGDGGFVAPHDQLIPDLNPHALIAAEMNGDGVKDLVLVAGPDNKGLTMLLADGQGNFSPTTLAFPVIHDVAAGDLDGDGDTDLVVEAPLAGAQSALLFNDGTGLDFPNLTPAFSFSPTDLELADIDNDGDLDLLSGHAPDKDLFLLRNDGAGGLLPQETLALGQPAVDVATGDLDMDGQLDIVATIFLQPQLAVLLGQAGGFGAPKWVAVPAKESSPVIADFDHNGLPDIAVARSKHVDVLFADTAATFEPAASFEMSLAAPKELRGADLDGDGWMDLATWGVSDSVVTFRNADGVLATPQATMIDSPSMVTLDDLEGDERPELAVASTFGTLQVLGSLLGGFPNVGYQHAASFGTPHLVTTGAPVPDTLVSFTATGAPPQSLGALFLGLQFTPQAFAGGTLVPSPDVIVPMLPGVALSGRWPALPAGTDVFVQAWFAAGGDVGGSNALVGATQ